MLWALGGSAGMWDMNRWSVSPPRPPLLARETVGMEMLGMVNTLETVARGDWVLVADSMTSCQKKKKRSKTSIKCQSTTNHFIYAQ